VTLHIRKGNYISRIWFFSGKGEVFDVAANLFRELPDGVWTLSWRFRFYRDDSLTQDTDDIKQAWSCKLRAKSEDEAIRECGPIIGKLKIITRLDFDLTIIGTDDPTTVVELMNAKPYFHLSFAGKGANN
jgi:hypothetical protein